MPYVTLPALLISTNGSTILHECGHRKVLMSHMSASNRDLLPPASLYWGVMKNSYCECSMAYMQDFGNVFDESQTRSIKSFLFNKTKAFLLMLLLCTNVQNSTKQFCFEKSQNIFSNKATITNQNFYMHFVLGISDLSVPEACPNCSFWRVNKAMLMPQ